MNYQLGIDVSHHQDPAKLDYEQLKAEGYTWMIARAAYGDKPDLKFVDHCKRAKDAGFLVGGYLFYRQSKSFRTQLDTFLAELAQVDFEIAPVVDLEWNVAHDGDVIPEHFNTDARKIIDELHAEFGECIAYLSPGFFQTLGNPEWLLKYPWWIAHYTHAYEPWCPFKNWDMWQYTGTGNVAAYNGDLDLNRARRLPLRYGAELAVERLPHVAGGELLNDCAERATLYREISERFARLAELEEK